MNGPSVHPEALRPKEDVQNAQRLAAIGTSLKHSGHFRVVGSGGASPRRIRAVKALTGSTTKK
jgi:hypothetical protein